MGRTLDLYLTEEGCGCGSAQQSDLRDTGRRSADEDRPGDSVDRPYRPAIHRRYRPYRSVLGATSRGLDAGRYRIGDLHVAR